MPEFQEIIEEIEYAYVNGQYFSAISSACGSTERLLNLAGIKLHKYNSKIKSLWGKDSLNAWDQDIDALKQWNYLDNDFALNSSRSTRISGVPTCTPGRYQL